MAHRITATHSPSNLIEYQKTVSSYFHDKLTLIFFLFFGSSSSWHRNCCCSAASSAARWLPERWRRTKASNSGKEWRRRSREELKPERWDFYLIKSNLFHISRVRQRRSSLLYANSADMLCLSDIKSNQNCVSPEKKEWERWKKIESH